jgi:hypothetical protein
MMFNLKRMIMLGFLALALNLAAFVFPSTGIASAHTTTAAIAAASCTYNGCDHKSPVSTGCENSAVIEKSDSGTLSNGITVTIQLQFSTSCHAAWGREVFSKKLPSGYQGHAELVRKNDLADALCSDAGGDGDVLPGQSVCYTSMLGDGPSQSTVAFGWVGVGGAWNAPVSTSAF